MDGNTLTNLRRDLLIALLMVIALFVTFYFLDLFDLLYHFSREYEDWELDEIILMIFALPVPLGWFAYRRLRDNMLLLQEQVMFAKELAHSRKIESLGVMAGGLAHELNNQLVPVTSLAELLLSRTAETAPDRRKLELIVKGATGARETVSRILKFARREQLDGGACDVAMVLEGLSELLKISCPSKVNLCIEVEDNIGRVGMPADDLENVLVGLFNNAVHALDELHGSIDIKARAVRIDLNQVKAAPVPGAYAEITVRDTGKGIAPENLDRIFDPFFTTKVVGEGTGLGLSHSKNVIEKAGGSITVESELDRGTIATIHIPLVVT